MSRITMHDTPSPTWYPPRAPQRSGKGKKRSALRPVLALSAGLVMAAACWPNAGGQVIYVEDAHTQYTHGVPRDAITKLQADLDKGRLHLKFDSKFGYLPALLDALRVSRTSQVVVFSKTSVQKDLISPENPRSIYYNDSTYIGYVPDGKALELCTNDPYLGAVYYTILQREVPRPRFFRTVDACLECHADRALTHLPQHMMFTTRCTTDGAVAEGTQPVNVSDATSFSKRFGGWYVSGNTGQQEHMGNAFATQVGAQVTMQHSVKGDVLNLNNLYDTSLTLTPYSDIAALMVLTHQYHIQNQIGEVTYRVNSAMAFERLYPRAAPINSTTGHSVSTDKTVKDTCDVLLREMLFADEATIPAPLAGNSGFTAAFEKMGPFDRHGRSLRQLNLKTRLLKYPFSYLIYSDAFDAIPVPARRYLYHRLRRILTGKDQDPIFAKRNSEVRRAILEILTETKPDFTKYGS